MKPCLIDCGLTFNFNSLLLSVHFISADRIFNGKNFLPENSVLVLNQHLQFIECVPKNSIDADKIRVYEGIITPGFVNSHCHTELSHLKNKITQKTGLVEFGKHVITLRNSFSKEEITGIQMNLEQVLKPLQKAIKKGDVLGLSEDFITKYFDAVHLESINHQNKVMNS